MASSSTSRKISTPEILAYLALLLAVVAGVYARFKGLGTWPLADDEYHTVVSIQNILEKGVPAFDCGGYYIRGILYQYVLALADLASNYGSELTYRVVSVVSNILCIPPLFLLARKLGGRLVAVGAVILFLLSVWEIEYARYIRMYATFQAIFVWYLYFTYRVLFEDDKSSNKWLYCLSLTGVLVHAAGIFLILMNFFPAFMGKVRFSSRYFTIPLSLLVIAFLYLTFDFKHIGVGNYLPADIALETVKNSLKLGRLDLPRTFLFALRHTPDWQGYFITLLVFLAGMAWLILRAGETDSGKKLIFLLWLLLAVANQYSLIIYSLITFWLLGWLEYRDVRRRATLYLSIAIIATLLFWTLYALNTTAWHTVLQLESAGQVRGLFIAFLKYPDILEKIIYPWSNGIPLTILLSAGLIATGTLLSIGDRSRQDVRFFYFLLAVMLITGILVGITRQPYHNSRYSFFMYPVVILLTVYSIKLLSQKIGAGKSISSCLFLLFTGGYIAIADDYDFNHIIKIDSAEVNYRTLYSTPKTFHLFNRMDFRTPAEYVNKAKGQNDIVITTVRPARQYLDGLDYFYMSPGHKEFFGISACGGEKELWTNANLLYTREMLLAYIDNHETPVWLIIRSSEYPYPNKDESFIAENYKAYLQYMSIDRSIAVYRFN